MIALHEQIHIVTNKQTKEDNFPVIETSSLPARKWEIKIQLVFKFNF